MGGFCDAVPGGTTSATGAKSSVTPACTRALAQAWVCDQLRGVPATLNEGGRDGGHPITGQCPHLTALLVSGNLQRYPACRRNGMLQCRDVRRNRRLRLAGAAAQKHTTHTAGNHRNDVGGRVVRWHPDHQKLPGTLRWGEHRKETVDAGTPTRVHHRRRNPRLWRKPRRGRRRCRRRSWGGGRRSSGDRVGRRNNSQGGGGGRRIPTGAEHNHKHQHQPGAPTAPSQSPPGRRTTGRLTPAVSAAGCYHRSPDSTARHTGDRTTLRQVNWASTGRKTVSSKP